MKNSEIITVTLNPAIDLTLSLKEFNVGHVNIVQSEISNPGGKGVNVSYYLSLQGYHSQALGFLGADNVGIFNGFFARNRIDHNFILVNGKTRTNIKIADNKNAHVTDVNSSSFLVTEQNKQDFKAKLLQVKNSKSIFVLAGSLPKGVEDGFYSDLLVHLKDNKVILDTSGNALKHVINSPYLPYAIKPNEYELAQAMDCDVRDFIDEYNILKAIEDLKHKGIALVVVSLGERGMIFSHKDCTYRVRPVVQQVKSTVGAGDALVSGLALALEHNLTDEETILLCTSLSMGAVGVLGIGLPDKDILNDLRSHMDIQRF